eukprot:snap_masked-scaffold_11-processed-gene-5.21-mRNA-1 protein AED:0.29 eAED:0.32 QI:0/0/0/1/1/1/2/0/242
MEKECGFFKLLFGGDDKFCAEATSSLFAGLWFRKPSPNGDHLQWIGRLITNYQHSEATIHFLIVFLGLGIVYYLSSPTPQKVKVPAKLRWLFFFALYFETVTMCVPYLFLFAWAWSPFTGQNGTEDFHNSLVTFIQNLDPGEGVQKGSFTLGVQFGAALITMFWVSVLVLILDGVAMWKAWKFAWDGREQTMWTAVVYGGTIAFLVSATGRGGVEGASLTEIATDALHHLFGEDYTPMSSLL